MSRKRGETQDFWHQLWTGMGDVETHDIWYEIDRTKLRYLKPYLPTRGLSLEVGCGTARLSRFLEDCGLSVVGLDYEPAALKLAAHRAKAAGQEMALVLGDAFSLPFADNSFGVVLSTGLLEHFADSGPIVSEMTRVLRPGGLFYSDIVPNKFSLMRLFKKLRRRRNDVWERGFNKAQITTLLSGKGLQVKTVFAAGIYSPLLPYVDRQPDLAFLQTKAMITLGRILSRLDGTEIAETLGLYYIACAQKPFPKAWHAGTKKQAA